MPLRLSMQAAHEDRTERAMFDAFLLADEFRIALAEADSLDRLFQIHERIKVALGQLMDAENAALRYQTAMTKGRMH